MTSSTDTTADYYRILGISPEAGHEEIRAAYRGKLRLWHPDLVAAETEDVRQAATEMTAQLKEAYECLSDPDLRTAYHTTRSTSTSLLVLSPRTMRCELTPGDTVHLTLNVQADSPPRGGRLQVRTAQRFQPSQRCANPRARRSRCSTPAPARSRRVAQVSLPFSLSGQKVIAEMGYDESQPKVLAGLDTMPGFMVSLHPAGE